VAIRNIEAIPLKELFDEYSNLLFKPNDEGSFNFKPISNSDAEYWFYFLHRELESLERSSEQVRDNIKRLSPLGDYPQGQILSRILIEIQKNKQKIDSIRSWFEANGLKDPHIPTELEWEVMKTAYVQVVKENTKKRLSNVTDRFSAEGGKKEDFYGSFWALADEMRFRKKQGEFETFAEAYRFAEKYITINGNPVTAKQLQNNYYKTKSSSTLLDD